MKCVSCGDQLEDGTKPVTHSENQANDSELLLCVHCREAFFMGVQHGEMRMTKAAETVLAPSIQDMVQQVNDRKKF